VPVIAQLVQADEDTVRDVIHRFNEIGLACLDPQWAGGRPRQLNSDDEDFVIQTAITRPTKLGQPFTRWSLRKLVAYLRKVHGRVIRIGREALRGLLARRGITLQRTKTWKEFPDPERDAELDHTVQTRALHAYLRWRNVNARHRDVLAAERRERARIRSEKGIRWGGRPLPAAA
jgi:transposase